VKLQSVNNNYLSKISTDELYNQSLVWANKYRPEVAKLMQTDVPYVKAAMNIERHTPKDPKRFTTYADVETQLRFFFDSEWTKMNENRDSALCTLHSTLPKDVLKNFVTEYVTVLDLTITVEERFAQLKEI
jgi:hypothetical protein